MDAAVSRAFGRLRRPVHKNLAALTVAFLRVLGAARSGHGRLSLGALFRVLPTPGTPHAREKRLHRFLGNPRLDPRGVTEGLARLIFGRRGQGLWPIAFDQTKAGATQALVAGVPFAGRTLPLAVYTFAVPLGGAGGPEPERPGGGLPLRSGGGVAGRRSGRVHGGPGLCPCRAAPALGPAGAPGPSSAGAQGHGWSIRGAA